MRESNCGVCSFPNAWWLRINSGFGRRNKNRRRGCAAAVEV